MGSTGEPDRKRRHFGSISPTAAATPKKQPFLPISEDKKVRSVYFRSFYFLIFRKLYCVAQEILWVYFDFIVFCVFGTCTFILVLSGLSEKFIQLRCLRIANLLLA